MITGTVKTVYKKKFHKSGPCDSIALLDVFTRFHETKKYVKFVNEWFKTYF